MNLEGYTKEQLWGLVVEAAHANVMYPTHKAYTRDVILKEKPDISPEELAPRLNMALGLTAVMRCKRMRLWLQRL